MVRIALALGYRHIDTAQAYGNEVDIGRAIADSGVPRDRIFLTTELEQAHLARRDVRPALEASLARLRTRPSAPSGVVMENRPRKSRSPGSPRSRGSR